MASYVAGAGEFSRDTNYITTRVTADGRDGYSAWKALYRLGFAVRLMTSAAGLSISISATSTQC
jgi:hypothetical protein